MRPAPQFLKWPRGRAKSDACLIWQVHRVSYWFKPLNLQAERGAPVSILTSIQKGFSFFLMSMGVSTYDKKPKPAPQPPSSPPAKPE